MATPAGPSGELRTSMVNVTQKNGDIYVMERQTLYDPASRRRPAMDTARQRP